MEQITLTFDGKDYTAREDQAWGLIEVIEDVVSLMELAPKMQEQKPPIMKIMRAYAAALKYCGCKDITPDKVREGVKPQDAVRMGYELVAIMGMGMPTGDVELPKVEQTELAKKKPRAKSSKAASKAG